ncbi:MAG TPA: hypothetical protein VHE35_25350 [Kofleriaceae bacterium]|nr:hypothetical protein [Kofleriaceae bacterium]
MRQGSSRAALAALAALAGPGLAACIDEAWRAPVATDEIIANATVTVDGSGTAFADGRTRLTFGFDVPDVDGLDPSLQATLHVAGGTWVLPDSSGSTTKTVAVTGGHQDAALVAGTTPGTLVATATIEEFTATASRDLVPLTADDAITMLTTPAVAPVADGTTPITIHVCTTDELVHDPMAQVTLHTSDGTWIGASAGDSKSLVANLSTTCVDGSLIPGQTPGRIEVTATVARFTKSLPIDLGPAVIDRVVCSASGGISAGAGTITVTARLVAHGGARPSLGTEVAYRAEVLPGTARGYFTQPVVLLDSGNSAMSSFVTFGYPTSIVLTATATPAGGTAVDCPSITVQGAPPPA